MILRPSLATLAKSPQYTHVHFLQHLGSVEDLWQGKIGPNILDPLHPACKTPSKHFPQTANRYFRLRAFPNALLLQRDAAGAPSLPKIDYWVDRVARASELRNDPTLCKAMAKNLSPSNVSPKLLEFVTPPILQSHLQDSIPMSLYFSMGKARTHKHAVKRRRIRTKMKAAINLVVTRGADVKQAGSGVKEELTFNDEEVQQRGDRWILPDWSYLCLPNPELYLATYPKLVRAVRESLERIWGGGMRLEELWAQVQVRNQKRPERQISRKGGLTTQCVLTDTRV